MSEHIEVKRKRLYMRSIRRGIKEMDLILMAFSDAHLEGMDETQLNIYDKLLSENDHDLYQWVSDQAQEPEIYSEMMGLMRADAVGVTKP